MAASEPIPTDEAYALELDARDPLHRFRAEFYLTPGMIYMDGNSLGLLSRRAEGTLQRVLDEWKRLGISGWLNAAQPWFTYAEALGDRMAPLVGAEPGEVVAHSSTTVNMHLLLASLYRPAGRRTKLLADVLNFPSDQYAIHTQVELAGLDPAEHLVRVPSRDGRLIDEDDAIALMDDTVALALFPAVQYRSGQLLDIPRLTRAAHERGLLIGFDGCHSVGVVPHRFSEWGVDFAFWCTYKYLNSGPGGIAGLYLNKRHSGVQPRLAGWWGNNKQTQFDMAIEFDPAADAGRMQLGTVHVLSAAPLEGALEMFAEAGIAAVREKSVALTEYLIALADAALPEAATGYRVGSPRDPARRGGHVGLEHARGVQIAAALRQRGVVPDFRRPNVIRLAPIPLYTSFHDVWRVVGHLREIVDTRAYEAFAEQAAVVS
jgi:kynureninase